MIPRRLETAHMAAGIKKTRGLNKAHAMRWRGWYRNTQRNNELAPYIRTALYLYKGNMRGKNVETIEFFRPDPLEDDELGGGTLRSNLLDVGGDEEQEGDSFEAEAAMKLVDTTTLVFERTFTVTTDPKYIALSKLRKVMLSVDVQVMYGPAVLAKVTRARREDRASREPGAWPPISTPGRSRRAHPPRCRSCSHSPNREGAPLRRSTTRRGPRTWRRY